MAASLGALLIAGQGGAVVVALAGLGAGLAVCRLQAQDRPFLYALFLAAYAARLAAAVALYFLAPTVRLDELVPDTTRFHQVGALLARQWQGEPVEVTNVELYDLVLGVTYFVTGASPLSASCVNAALAAIATVLFTVTTQYLFDHRTARVAGIAVAFFPSVFFWSIVPLREALYSVLLAVCVWSATGFAATGRLSWLIALFAGWWLLRDVRYYAFVLIAPLVLGLLAVALLWTRRRAALTSLVVLAAVGLVASPGFNRFLGRYLSADLWTVLERQRAVNAVGAATAFVAPAPPAEEPVFEAPAAQLGPIRFPWSGEAPCTDARIMAFPAAPQPLGTSVRLVAIATGCGGAVEYRWFTRRSDGSWSLLRDWGGATLDWATDQLDPGDHAVAVWARRVGSAADWEAYAHLTYALGAHESAGNTLAGLVTPAPRSDVSAAPAPPEWSRHSSFERTIAYLPTGIAYLLAAPFPWEATKLTQKLTIPDMVLWYVAVLLVLPGCWQARHRWRLALFPFGYLTGMALVLLLTEGNTGTLYRHRAMMIPVVLCFSAAGLLWACGKVVAWQSAPHRVPPPSGNLPSRTVHRG